MKLETSIRELHEMFMDMAMFVETQVMRHLPHAQELFVVNAELKPECTLPLKATSQLQDPCSLASCFGRAPQAAPGAGE